VEEADRVGERVLDQHTLRVAGDQLGWGALAVIGQQYCRFVVTQILDEQLTEARAGQRDGLFKHPGGVRNLRAGTSSSIVRQAERGSSMTSLSNAAEQRRSVMKVMPICSRRARLA
jgi:hypothetical protein